MKRNKINRVDSKCGPFGHGHRYTEKYSHGGLTLEMTGFGRDASQAMARCRLDLLRTLDESGHDPDGVSAFRFAMHPGIEQIAGRS